MRRFGLRRCRRGNRILVRRKMYGNTKCTPRRRKIILTALKMGLSQKRAFELAGITPHMYYQWLKKGREYRNQTYHHFYIRVKSILAKEERQALDVIKQAMKGGEKIVERKVTISKKGTEVQKTTKKRGSNWQAAAWRLERMDPESYGRKFFDSNNLDADNKLKSPDQIAREVKEAAERLFASVPETTQYDEMPDDMPS
jgi:hypothetical protein